MLSWIAARYLGQRLGTIVMSNSFRSPSLMAKMGASLQEMSSGRFILGYGAGWFQGEYDAYGYDYPSTRTRVEMLEEGVQVIRKMWTEAPATFTGKHYSVSEAHCEPLPDPAPADHYRRGRGEVHAEDSGSPCGLVERREPAAR